MEAVLEVLAEGLLEVRVDDVVGRLADGEDDRGLSPVDQVTDHLQDLEKTMLRSL